MGFVTVIGTGFGAYIMGMAVLSPCPLLVDTSSGTAIIVSSHKLRRFYFGLLI